MYYKGQPTLVYITKGELHRRNFIVKTDDFNNIKPILRYFNRGNHEFDFMLTDVDEQIERKVYPLIKVLSALDIDQAMLKTLNGIRELAESNFNQKDMDTFEKLAERVMELHGRFYKTYVDGKPQFDRGGFPIKEDEEHKEENEDNG